MSLPILGLLALFFVFSNLNRLSIKNRVEALVEEQLQTTSDVLTTHIAELLAQAAPPETIFPLYAGEESIHFMALLDDDKRILGWSSRFEGYLPLSLKELEARRSWTLDSPVGRIFNLFSSFPGPAGENYYLYLGYSLNSLEEMLSRSRRSFWLFFGLLSGVGALFFSGMYRLQNRYLSRTRELEEQIREKLHYREISAFTSGVAHEIKNPLNSLALLCDLFEKKAPEEMRRDALAGKREVNKISRIIDQFSAGLRPLQLKKESIVWGDMVHGIRDSLQATSGKSAPVIEISGDPALSLKADREMLGQVLINLINNAQEAAPGNTIHVSARKHKRFVMLRILDAGPGISREDLPHIFDPFFSRKQEGLGIGLYLSKKIIDAHNGNLRADSLPGKGTAFVIQLPGD